MSAKNTNSHLRVRMLCEGAMMVALAQVLSYIKLMELPNGGSLTPAMFPIILFAVRWGLTPGLMAGFTFGLLQLIFDGAYAWGWQSMLLDYLVAFTPLGLAGLFKGKKWGIFVGTVVGCLGRFVVHYISGVTIYKILAPTEFMKWTFTSPSAYSLVYNSSENLEFQWRRTPLLGFPRTPFTRKGYAASAARQSRWRLPYLTVAENLPFYRQS